MVVFTNQLEEQKAGGNDNKMPHPAVFWLFSSILIIMSIVIIGGIGAIIKVQVINFYIGKTTNERFSTHTETSHKSNF